MTIYRYEYSKHEDKLIIGIHGKAETGKDTLAKFLYGQFPLAEIRRFAQPLKDMLAAMYGFNPIQFENLEFKNSINPITGMTWRSELQFTGTELYRNQMTRDHWIRIMDHNIKSDFVNDVIVIPDVRFQNEVNYISSLANGYIISLTRPEYNSSMSEKEARHESEEEVNFLNFDASHVFYIENSGGLNYLCSKAELVADTLGTIHPQFV